MLGQDRPETARELFEALLPVLGLAAAVGWLAFLSRPGGALSDLGQLPTEEDTIASLDRAEAALEAVRGCRRNSVVALQVAERELGKAQVLAQSVAEDDVRKFLKGRISTLSRAAADGTNELSRCITGR